jgi:hypothetical protein
VLNTEEHLDNLIRHIELVREACILLGKRLIKSGRVEFGRLLIAKGFEHDVSKFYGIEWEYLHAGNDVDKEDLSLAVFQHIRTNQHHPEYWGNIENMPELAVAEMVCDWYARSQEFGTSFKDWVISSAVTKFSIDIDGEVYKWINKFISMLLVDSFVR